MVANVTYSVGIWTGYLGGVAGFRREVAAQRDRVRALAPVAFGGALVGAVLLLVTPDDLFEEVAPVLVLLACALFAAQPALAGRLRARRAERRCPRPVDEGDPRRPRWRAPSPPRSTAATSAPASA